ncbi:MAG: sigma-70 domain-containing protein, partial [Blastococcus sp.]
VMNNGKVIRLPAYMVSLLAKWKRATAALADRLGRPPTNEEVGKALRLSKKKLGIVAKAIRVNALTPHPEGDEEDGFAIGEVLGMVIGTSAGVSNGGTVVQSIALAFSCGRP